MMKRFKIISVLLVYFMVTSCAGKVEDKDINLGMTLVNRAVDYQLQGREKMASYTYNRAVSKFRDMGDFCNMSRTAIAVVTVDPETSLSLLEDARAFAALGRCSEETNIVNFLMLVLFLLEDSLLHTFFLLFLYVLLTHRYILD